MKKLEHPFIMMVFYALLGALIGLVTGFIFGLIIYGIATFLYEKDILQGMYPVATFLGMGCGTVLGAILGGFVGIRKIK